VKVVETRQSLEKEREREKTCTRATFREAETNELKLFQKYRRLTLKKPVYHH